MLELAESIWCGISSKGGSDHEELDEMIRGQDADEMAIVHDRQGLLFHRFVLNRVMVSMG